MLELTIVLLLIVNDPVVPSSVLQSARQSSDPHIIYADFDHRGYGVVTVKKNELLGEFKAVNNAKVPHGKVSTLAKFRVDSGSPVMHQV